MGLAVFLLLLIILVGLALVAFLVSGIVFVVIGAKQKAQGKKGTIGKVGIALLMVPVLIMVCSTGYAIWQKIKIKCVADKWRYTNIYSGEGTAPREMLRSLLDSIEDEDIETFSREFTLEISDDKDFDDTVDDFFDDLDDLDLDLDADEFLSDFGDSVFVDFDHSGKEYTYDIGRVYDAEIDGETYYIYERVCTRDDRHRDRVGLVQFIICTEDRVDELYELIESREDDIYLAIWLDD